MRTCACACKSIQANGVQANTPWDGHRQARWKLAQQLGSSSVPGSQAGVVGSCRPDASSTARGQGVQQQPHLLGRLGLGQRLLIGLCFGAQKRIHLLVQLSLDRGPISPGLLEHDLGQQHVAVRAVPARGLGCGAWLGFECFQGNDAATITLKGEERWVAIHQTGTMLLCERSVRGSALDLPRAGARQSHKLGLARGAVDCMQSVTGVVHWHGISSAAGMACDHADPALAAPIGPEQAALLLQGSLHSSLNLLCSHLHSRQLKVAGYLVSHVLKCRVCDC